MDIIQKIEVYGETYIKDYSTTLLDVSMMFPLNEGVNVMLVIKK